MLRPHIHKQWYDSNDNDPWGSKWFIRICHILHIINSDRTVMIMIPGGVNGL